MLSLQNAGKRFGPRILFLEADWLIRSREKTALVGANGTGKSTLMKVLAGLETLDYGNMQQTRGMSIGYLPQEGLRLTGRTIFDECLTVFDELRAMEGEIERVAAQLAELDHASPEYDAAAERYSPAGALPRHGRLRPRRAGRRVLTGLGFSKEDWSRQTDEFCGGWQMRIALAKLLLARPNLLLLDEPTNHLDLETRNWLEDYLKSYPFGYILISHDRYFLDVTIDRTVEIWNKRLTIYQGNYTKYLTQKEDRRTQLEAAYRNQRDQIEHLEAFINRFRAQATKAKQVQSRIKELEKIERIEIPEEEPVIHFKFPQPPPSGRIVVEAEGLAKELRREASLQQRTLLHRARRSRRSGRRQRRGQINTDQIAHRRRVADRGHRASSATTSSPNTSRRISTKCWTAMRACSTTSAALPSRCRSLNCARCSAASSSPATTSSSSSACFPAASAIASPWRASWFHHPTFCCSTSPRTTSTCAPKTCCLTRSLPSAGL